MTKQQMVEFSLSLLSRLTFQICKQSSLTFERKKLCRNRKQCIWITVKSTQSCIFKKLRCQQRTTSSKRRMLRMSHLVEMSFDGSSSQEPMVRIPCSFLTTILLLFSKLKQLSCFQILFFITLKLTSSLNHGKKLISSWLKSKKSNSKCNVKNQWLGNRIKETTRERVLLKLIKILSTLLFTVNKTRVFQKIPFTSRLWKSVISSENH